ncbi:MAG: DegT/DnrJ/EryC1/StrS family aminotransferase [Actinomycetota bacterium]|nr:DegT/DnrJ/EryC1/StrS family aminotransferase [Actinomycetota bacterium]
MSTIETSLRKVPLTKTEISPEAIAAVAEVLASGWVTTGPQVQQFESEFGAYVDAEHAIAVSSCTAALELSLRALKLPKGTRVLTSTMTFCGAVNAIIHAGLEPVLVDVDPETCMPDARTTAAAVRRSGHPHAMIVTHFAGHPAPVEELALAAGLPLERVIEDAAHGLATFVGDRPVGSISAATCFSFYASKNLPIGEGGMITTSDPKIAEFVRMARLHGMSRDAWKRYMPGSGWRYDVQTVGLKANMTDIQAAIGRSQLLHLDRWQERRRDIAERYHRGLSAIDGLSLPPLPLSGRHAWHLYVVKIEKGFGLDRDGFIAALSDVGVGCSVHFIPVHQLTSFQRALTSHPEGSLARADGVFEQIVSLPMHQGLSDEDVDYVIHQISQLRNGDTIRLEPAVSEFPDTRRPPRYLRHADQMKEVT